MCVAACQRSLNRQCYGFSNAPTLANSTWSYRLPFLIQIVLSTILCVASLCLPFSPRWLALKGRAAEAEHVLELMQKPGQFSACAQADKRRRRDREGHARGPDDQRSVRAALQPADSRLPHALRMLPSGLAAALGH